MRINHGKLLGLRKERGLTQEQVARGANVSLSTYRRYECGHGHLRLASRRVDLHENLRDLANFFELNSVAALLLDQPGEAEITQAPAASGEGLEEPFQVHRPLDHPSQFYGRTALLRTLFGWWRRAPLASVALSGPRSSGKTSLLRQLQHLVVQQGLRSDQHAPWLAPPGGLRLVLVDFNEPRLRRPAGLLQLLTQRLELPAEAARDLDHFVEHAAEHLRAPTIILCDHLDTLRGEQQPAAWHLDDDFWDAMRSLICNYSGGMLAFTVATQSPPRALVRAGGRASSFFALCRALVLEPLEEEEARALVARSPLPFPEEDVRWLLEVSGRWPRLLQLGCEHRLRALREGTAGWREAAAREIELFLS